MATIQLYNHTAALFASGTCIAGDTYKVMLLNSSASFNAAHTALTTVSNAGAYEVSGNGWDVGGEPLASVAIGTVTTNDAAFTAANLLVNISGGSLGPYSAYVIYNDTDANDPPLAFVTLTAAQTVADGGVAGAIWNTDGIFKWTVA